MTRPRTVTRPGPAQRCAESMIRIVCRALPDAERADSEAEWAAEAEAIGADTEIRVRALRAVKVLLFAISLLVHVRSVRSTRTAAPAAARPAAKPSSNKVSRWGLVTVVSGNAIIICTISIIGLVSARLVSGGTVRGSDIGFVFGSVAASVYAAFIMRARRRKRAT